MVKLTMVDGTKSIHFESEQVDPANLDHLLSQMFVFFNIATEQKPKPIPVIQNITTMIETPQKIETVKTVLKDSSIKSQAADIVRRAREKDQAHQKDANVTIKSRPKQLPFIGSERTLSQSLGEKFAAALEGKSKEDIPEYWTTGIKVDEDGTNRYKTYYKCSCGKKGNHYIPVGVVQVQCRVCDNWIDVKPATQDEEEKDGEMIPKRDDFGNFFVAFDAKG